jgi:hypothetical protein
VVWGPGARDDSGPRSGGSFLISEIKERLGKLPSWSLLYSAPCLLSFLFSSGFFRLLPWE